MKCLTGVLYTGDFNRLLAGFAPARLVPSMRTPDGEVVGKTRAIAETLTERHPAFCRDKTLAEPVAWPALMAIVAR